MSGASDNLMGIQLILSKATAVFAEEEWGFMQWVMLYFWLSWLWLGLAAVAKRLFVKTKKPHNIKDGVEGGKVVTQDKDKPGQQLLAKNTAKKTSPEFPRIAIPEKDTEDKFDTSRHKKVEEPALKKTRVYALARQYGFKSIEFVKILGEIGFHVSSYQASIERWDLPVIEERLKRGGFISGNANAEDEDADESAKSSNRDSLMKPASIANDQKVEVAEVAEVVETEVIETVDQSEAAEKVKIGKVFKPGFAHEAFPADEEEVGWSQELYEQLYGPLEEPAPMVNRSMVYSFLSRMRSEAQKRMSSWTSEHQESVYRSLNRGEAILNTQDQLDCYLHSYCKMHHAKLQHALDGFGKWHKSTSTKWHKDVDDPESRALFRAAEYAQYESFRWPHTKIIDYGCGLGIGTITLLEYLYGRLVGADCNITLIDPSIVALERAKSCLHEAGHRDIQAVNKGLNGIEPLLGLSGHATKFHIFSNVLDIDSIDLKALVDKILLTTEGTNYFICIVPNSHSKNERLDEFVEHLEAGVLYSNGRHESEVVFHSDAKIGKWYSYIKIFRIYINPEYDEEGYDEEGYDEEGYDEEGFSKEGFDGAGQDRNGYEKTHDEKRYDHELPLFDQAGYDMDGYDRGGYDDEGHDMEGYDKEGYDINGCDRDGWDRDGYSGQYGHRSNIT